MVTDEKKTFSYSKLKAKEPNDWGSVRCSFCRTKIILLESPYVSFFDHRDNPLAAEVGYSGMPLDLNRFDDGFFCAKCWTNKIEKKKKIKRA